ncbi:MAG: NmrA family NAD(P)-binding protein, partial [Chitinispirillaceae bacterium]|nr:NmrA family NAD(P)-binding protein [Chitinispirillaceae bacterium]
RYIRAAGLRSTVLRPVFFMENLLAPDTLSAIGSGSLPLGLDPEKPLQMIAVEDIGAFAALAFDNPLGYVGESIDIAGDELTGPRMAEVLSRVLDHAVTCRQIPIEHIRAFDNDYAAMVEWFNAKGYEADIPALRKIRPALISFEQWATARKPELEAVPAPV